MYYECILFLRQHGRELRRKQRCGGSGVVRGRSWRSWRGGGGGAICRKGEHAKDCAVQCRTRQCSAAAVRFFCCCFCCFFLLLLFLFFVLSCWEGGGIGRKKIRKKIVRVDTVSFPSLQSLARFGFFFRFKFSTSFFFCFLFFSLPLFSVVPGKAVRSSGGRRGGVGEGEGEEGKGARCVGVRGSWEGIEQALHP